jgi:ribosome-associated protein
VLLDLSRNSTFCDVFMICHATNRRQVRAIAEGIVDELRKLGQRPIGVEGLDASRWVLIDFGDLVIHVFDEPMRGFYDLDALWGDAPRLVVEEERPVAIAAAPAG